MPRNGVSVHVMVVTLKTDNEVFGFATFHESNHVPRKETLPLKGMPGANVRLKSCDYGTSLFGIRDLNFTKDRTSVKSFHITR